MMKGRSVGGALLRCTVDSLQGGGYFILEPYFPAKDAHDQPVRYPFHILGFLRAQWA